MKVFTLILVFLLIIIALKFIFNKQDVKNLIISDALLNPAELNNHAKNIAEGHKTYKSKREYGFLFKHMDNNYRYIYHVYKYLNSSSKKDTFMCPASEWLLDNFYIIEEQVFDLQQSMNKNFFKKLKILEEGYLKNYPRIFAVCLEFVSHTDGKVDKNDLINFIDSYQSKKLLNISELWAIQSMIKIALMEKLRTICEKIYTTQSKWEEVEHLRGKDSDYILSQLKEKLNSMDSIDYTYIEHLLFLLKKKGENREEINEYINEKLYEFNTNIQNIINIEHDEQAKAQITMGNYINSLRLISLIDWNDIFDSLSVVEKILQSDPAEKYDIQDNKTKNLYRNAIQYISEKTKIKENKIAAAALNCCKNHHENANLYPSEHIGYYLIGKGTNTLYSELEYKDLIGINRHSSPTTYIALNILITLLIIMPLCIYSYRYGGGNIPLVILTGILSIIPSSDISITLFNWIVTHVIPPTILPKLEYKDGIPEECTTIVIIPTLLSSKKRVDELVEQLELTYLGNNDKNIYFALLGDLTDSSEELLENDNEITSTALNKIKALNNKYGYEQNKFFFLCRKRTYSKTQNRYMGWERKRGAILQFNSLIRGDSNTSYSIISSDLSLLRNAKYAITLDADTLMPIDSAKKLIGTISHPLNLAKVDSEKSIVVDGYGLIQPRIGVNIQSANKSFFSRVFGGLGGVDPYTTASSDVYQDLFGEGIFTGKGIYDIDIFNMTLKNSIPENAILSHDLLEGSYLRVGLATDIELIDGYPEKYTSYMMRLHRWTRGDWQIIKWLNRYVIDSNGTKRSNPINTLSKWKILDNLRRSLVSTSLYFFLLMSILFIPGNKLIYIAFFAATIFFPLILAFIDYMILRYYKAPRERLNGNLIYGLKAVFLSVILNFIFLPYHSYLMLDAVIKTLHRVNISKKNLLLWVTAADAENSANNTLNGYIKGMQIGLYRAAIFILLTYLIAPYYIICPIILGMFWFISPLVAYRISRETVYKTPQISEDDVQSLRGLALKTWEFYRDFTSSDDNYLPPDNFQIEPITRIAHRTSPTNIGFLLISTLSARDLGYITTSETLDRINNTISTMEKMDKWKGHLYNWYNTKTLEVLNPRYISTVDSGNLVGYLITLMEGLREYNNKPIFDNEFIYGIYDHSVLCSAPDISNLIREIDLRKKYNVIELIELLNRIKDKCNYTDRWDKNLSRLISSIIQELEDIFPEIIIKKDKESILNMNLPDYIKEQLIDIFPSCSLNDLYSIYDSIINYCNEVTNPDLISIRDEVHRAKTMVEYKLNKLDDLIKSIDKLQDNIKFSPLYDEKRKLFSIGYNIDEDKLTNSYYDLLASECRLASYIGVARREVPPSHWFRLGRSLTSLHGYRSLVSWTGTMFEYFMPALIMKNYFNTLMDETYKNVIKAQISYGDNRKVPWGTSESGFYLFDLLLNYQYKAFGVPALGLKRGLINDMVVSPYSTVLALSYNPIEAMKNINYLIDNKFDGEYGFYEAIDYTPERVPQNQRFGLVQSFMAHHQGMILIALNNYINKDIMINRFHSNKLIKGSEYLLQEKIPLRVIMTKEHKEEVIPLVKSKTVSIDVVRKYGLDDISFPKCHILSNGSYAVILTNSGCGYSKYNDINITRFREDLAFLSHGMFFFIKNINSNTVWSSSLYPLKDSVPDEYAVYYSPDKAKYIRLDDTIETNMQICVSPEDNCEVRKLTLLNHGNTPVTIECTSYCETVLTSHSADIAHPAFSNLFIRTEFLSEYKSLVSSRRPRNPDEPTSFAFQCISIDGEYASEVEYETDRYKFIGRGNDIMHPDSITHPLTNYTGPVLDPIMSIRQRIIIPPLKSVSLSYVTGFAENRATAVELSSKYTHFMNTERAFELAYIRSNMEYSYIGLNEKQIKTFDSMIPHILFLSPLRRKYEEKLKLNYKGQSSLWSYGISGDIPLILVTIKNMEDMDIVREMLKAHEYFRLKGLKTDLVILNEDETNYLQPLQNMIKDTVMYSNSKYMIDTPGGIFIKDANIIPKEDINLLFAASRLVIDASSDIPSQLKIDKSQNPYDEYKFDTSDREYQNVDQNIDVDFFNGYGGFSKEGKEYIIKLKNKLSTPLPWINVIANESFGCTVSESNLGYTWWRNSRENKITPWSNDPVSDVPGEIIYIRDDETGTVFTPTPEPIRETSSYIITHGIGYSKFKHNSHGIDTEVTVFVPLNSTVKICLVKLSNISDRKRKLSIYHYIKTVLGVSPQNTQQFVTSEYNDKLKTLLIKNPYNTDFSDGTVFTASNLNTISYTCDTEDFIGTNGTLSSPQAMKYKNLSNKHGAGLNPCLTVQYELNMDINESTEFVLLLGETDKTDEIEQIKNKYTNMELCTKSLDESITYWRDLTNVVQIKTPDKSADILMNSWLIYQTLSCRIWARSAFYQSGGAYGFRDQLQDVMSLLYAKPELARKQILLHCAHQFVEGDVQHWWHPHSLDKGIRTKFSDDLVWLPFVTCEYIKKTGDMSILDEVINYVEDAPLKENEDERYGIPKISQESSSVYEHCVRALERSLKYGEHDIPLMGSGDWNDGMNTVGNKGKGESVWLGWFIYSTLLKFASICKEVGDTEKSEKYINHSKKIANAIDENAWDGEWYRRAYFDDGTPLGSSINNECRIDSIAQSWSIISGAGDSEKFKRAMGSVTNYLVDTQNGLIKLFTPPFDNGDLHPGYIRGYVPGVRENGGQYTHASTWVIYAFAKLGDGNTAAGLYKLINPINHSITQMECATYKVEPYVMAADVYAIHPYIGRGGWTWYTGSSSWMYKVFLEEILGFNKCGDILTINPCIPSDWPEYSISYKYMDTSYDIVVKNISQKCTGVSNIKLDGNEVKEIQLINDNLTHNIEITM